VDGWVLILGLLPFVSIALVLVINFIQAAMTFLALVISPFSGNSPEVNSDNECDPNSLKLKRGCSDKAASIFISVIGSLLWLDVGEKAGPGIDLADDEGGDEIVHKITPFMGVMFGLDYFWIGNFANHISKGTNRSQWKRIVNLTTIYLMTALNAYVLAMDVKLYIEMPLSYFLGALCLRGILLPVLALFNPLVGFLFHTPEASMQGVFRGAFVLAVLVMIAALIGRGFLPGYLSTFRFDELPAVPANWSNVAGDSADHAVCTKRYSGLSVIELIGLAFGGYDIKRDESVFNQQMDFFFGPNATEWIDYEVIELEPDVPLLVYNISGTTVFAFRGFASGRELSVQVERLASLWVVPFFLDVLPLYAQLNERYLLSATARAYLLGWHWFSPRSPSEILVQKASEVYEDQRIAADSPVLFVGVNSGGTIAKRLALLKRRRSISFLSPPMDLDEFDNRHDLEDNATQWVTNVVNKDGLFSGEDTGFGENFALTGDPDIIGNDQIYRSFCNLAEICGHHAQFEEYCIKAIGVEDLATIRAYLGL
jgi:hypothetical protein